jgi:hypothetical protein
LANLSRPQIYHNLASDIGKTKQRDIKTTQNSESDNSTKETKIHGKST